MDPREYLQETLCRPQHVLLVERDVAAARQLRRRLEDRGHIVQHFLEAHQAVGAFTPDVLVGTIHGSEAFNALDLAESFQAKAFRPRHLFLAEAANVEDCRRALRLGAEDYLEKPLDAATLVARIEPKDQGAFETQLRLELTAGPDTAHTVARRICAFAMERGLGPSCRARIGTAVAELVDNVYRHAYSDGSGVVEVSAHLGARRLIVGIRDFGYGFQSEGVGSSWLPGDEGALRNGGLARVASLTEDFVVQSKPLAGTTVQVGFSTFQAHFDCDPPQVDLSELDFLTSEAASGVLQAIGEGCGQASFHLSPAIAVAVGRMLTGPDPRRVLQTAFRS